MSIDLSQLSAKELYELARQKELEEQEEQRRAELTEHLDKLKQQREEMLATFTRALGKLDSEIKQLQQQREQMMSEHDLSLAKLDGEIGQTREQAERPEDIAPAKPDKPAKSSGAASPADKHEELGEPEEPAKAQTAARKEKDESREPDIDEIFKDISSLMRGREYISESLLKERLRNMGYTSLVVTKTLENLTKEKRLIRKSGGSYVLGKKL